MWYSPDNFFDPAALGPTPLADFLAGAERVWDILDSLEKFILKIIKPNAAEFRRGGDLAAEAAGLWEGRVFRGATYELGDPTRGGLKVYHQGRHLPGAALIMPGAVIADDNIEIGAGALIESGALIKGPTIIGPASEVRQGAYVRGAVLSSPGSIIGHATEAKNALLLPGAKAGHFAYLGDSLLGRETNLGAGTKLANLKMIDSPHIFLVEGEKTEVRRRKFGAVLGDGVETGCNSVANPGVLLGPDSKVLPCVAVQAGYYPAGSIIRGR